MLLMLRRVVGWTSGFRLVIFCACAELVANIHITSFVSAKIKQPAPTDVRKHAAVSFIYVVQLHVHVRTVMLLPMIK